MKRLLILLIAAFCIFQACTIKDELAYVDARIDALEGITQSMVEQQVNAAVADLRKSLTEINEYVAYLESSINEMAGRQSDDSLAFMLEIDYLNVRIVQLEGDVQGLSGRTDQLESDVQGLSGRTDQLEDDVQGLSGRTGTLEDAVDELKNRATSLETDVLELESFVGDLSTGLGTCNENVNKALNQLNSVKNEVAGINTVVSSISGSVSVLQEKMDLMSEELDEANTSIETLNGKLSELAAKEGLDIQRVQGSVDNLGNIVTTNYNDLSGKIYSLDVAINNLSNEVNTRISGEISSVKSDIYSINGKIGTINGLISGINDEISFLKIRVSTNESEISTLKSNTQSLNNTLTGCVNDIAIINTSLQRVEGRTLTLESQVTVLQQAGMSMQSQIDEIVAQVQSVTVIPEYSDGSVLVTNTYNEFYFTIRPESAAEKLAIVGPDAFKMSAVSTKTKSVGSFVDMPISSVSYDKGSRMFKVVANGSALDEFNFFSGDVGASAILTIESGRTNITSDYIPLYAIVHPESVSIPSTLVVETGEIYQFVPKFNPVNVTNKNVTWSVSQTDPSTPTVLTVNAQGLLKAVQAGFANVIVTTEDKGRTSTCLVEVKSTVIAVTGVSLNTKDLGVKWIGDSPVTLTATVTPAEASNRNIDWFTDDSGIATVDDGVVSFRGVGKTTITAKSNANPAILDRCDVEVRAHVTEMTLDGSLDMVVGGEKKLEPSIIPNNAYDKSLKWEITSTSAKGVIKLTDGTVEALAPGTATVTVTSNDNPSVKKSCSITVTQPTGGVTLNKSTLSLARGKWETLIATVLPEDASDKKVIWTSSNSNVASVDQNGKVTAVAKGGPVTITATSNADKDKKAVCEVTVLVPVSGVELDQSQKTLNVEGSFTLTATVKPSDASNKNISWKSADPSIATVSGGTVTAVANGTTKITVTTEDGEKTAECTVVVVTAATSISVTPSTLSMAVGETTKLSATVNPPTSTDKVTWESQTPGVAGVSSDGTVTAKAVGTARIVAKAGNFTSYCDVTVRIPVKSISLPSTASVAIGATTPLAVTFDPTNATNKNVSWSSDNTSIATVDKSGVVKGVSKGSTIIRAVSEDGGCEATCTVTVNAVPTGIDLKTTTLDIWGIGNEGEIKANVQPSVADQKLTYTSSNESVATVSDAGVVTSKSGGTAMITVRTVNDITRTCTVNVIVATSIDIRLENDNTSLGYISGESITTQHVYADVHYSNGDFVKDAGHDRVAWSTSGSSATISSADLVVPTAGGTSVEIKATAQDGSGVSASKTYQIYALSKKLSWGDISGCSSNAPQPDPRASGTGYLETGSVTHMPYGYGRPDGCSPYSKGRADIIQAAENREAKIAKFEYMMDGENKTCYCTDFDIWQSGGSWVRVKAYTVPHYIQFNFAGSYKAVAFRITHPTDMPKIKYDGDAWLSENAWLKDEGDLGAWFDTTNDFGTRTYIVYTDPHKLPNINLLRINPTPWSKRAGSRVNTTDDIGYGDVTWENYYGCFGIAEIEIWAAQ